MTILEALGNRITRGTKMLKDRCTKCVELKGDYVKE